MVEKFDKDFEEEILAQCMIDKNYLMSATNSLEEHHFASKQHGWCWRIIKRNWDKHKELTTPKLFLKKASNEFKDSTERLSYLKLVRKLKNKNIENPRASLEELNNFLRMVGVQLFMEKSIDSMEKGKIDEIYLDLKDLSRKDFRKKDIVVIDWFDEIKKRQKERKRRKENPDKYKRYETGLLKLDKIIHGLGDGELGLILATTNQGKSIMLTNFAHSAVLRNYNAVYFSLEMSAEQIATRQDARFFKMLYNNFKYYNFKPSELRKIKRRIKNSKERFSKKLKIVSYPVKRCDINLIKNTLYDLERLEKFRPDLILIDSGDHMNSTRRYDQVRVEQASVYWDLKALAEEEQYAIWSSCHAGRDWADKIATAEATAESYDKSRIADVVLSLNTPSKRTRSTKVMLDDEGDGEGYQEDLALLATGRYIEMYLAKNRDGESRISFPLDAELSKMIIKEMKVD